MAARVLRVPPIPHFLAAAPAASGSLKRVLVLARLAADPEPRAAKLDNQPRQPEQHGKNLAEFFCGFGGLVVLVRAGVVLALELLEKRIVLVVDLLNS